MTITNPKVKILMSNCKMLDKSQRNLKNLMKF